MKKLKIAGALAVVLLASACVTTRLYELDDVYFRLTEDEGKGIFRVVNESTGKLVEERHGEPGPLYTLIADKGKNYGEDVFVIGASEAGAGSGEGGGHH